jgi:hypothetical protein
MKLSYSRYVLTEVLLLVLLLLLLRFLPSLIQKREPVSMSDIPSVFLKDFRGVSSAEDTELAGSRIFDRALQNTLQTVACLFYMKA